jgi:hypothetical protein
MRSTPQDLALSGSEASFVANGARSNLSIQSMSVNSNVPDKETRRIFQALQAATLT